MYKPSLMTALITEHEDAAKKFMEARNTNAVLAEEYLERMCLIAKNMKYLRQMMDGTIGHCHGTEARTQPTVTRM